MVNWNNSQYNSANLLPPSQLQQQLSSKTADKLTRGELQCYKRKASCLTSPVTGPDWSIIVITLKNKLLLLSIFKVAFRKPVLGRSIVYLSTASVCSFGTSASHMGFELLQTWKAVVTNYRYFTEGKTKIKHSLESVWDVGHVQKKCLWSF